MKSDEEISIADSAQIESLIERVNQGKLEQYDAQLIERLLGAFLTLITLLQRKNATIKRLKQCELMVS
jgi:chorismate mutase